MQTIIDFLRQLAANNNREWFTAHKDECKAAQAQFGTWVEGLAQRMAADDPTLAGLTARDMTYRIYREYPFFARTKTPYKTHMGAFICRGGKKSGYAGYYFQIGAEDNRADFGSFHWETQHIVAPGHYCIEPKALQVLREDIVYGEAISIVSCAVLPRRASPSCARMPSSATPRVSTKTPRGANTFACATSVWPTRPLRPR